MQAPAQHAANVRRRRRREARSSRAIARGSRRSCPRPSRRRTPCVRRASRRARSRTPRCRCACRPACRAPARGSCTPACRRSGPSSSVGSEQRSADCDIASAVRRRSERLRQPEVEHLHLRRLRVILMLAGFRSRWTMPLLVRGVERLGDLPRRSASASASGRRPSRASSAVRESCRPASALRPAPSPARRRRRRLRARESWRCADDSAPPAAAPRASNRASRSGSLAKRGGSTLIATSRPSFVSRARYTSPMPPAPSGPTISKEPSFVPTARLTLRPEDSDTTTAVDEAKKAFRPSPFSRLTPHGIWQTLVDTAFEAGAWIPGHNDAAAAAHQQSPAMRAISQISGGCVAAGVCGCRSDADCCQDEPGMLCAVVQKPRHRACAARPTRDRLIFCRSPSHDPGITLGGRR